MDAIFNLDAANYLNDAIIIIINELIMKYENNIECFTTH
jgi:hypothetical protein